MAYEYVTVPDTDPGNGWYYIIPGAKLYRLIAMTFTVNSDSGFGPYFTVQYGAEDLGVLVEVPMWANAVAGTSYTVVAAPQDSGNPLLGVSRGYENFAWFTDPMPAGFAMGVAIYNADFNDFTFSNIALWFDNLLTGDPSAGAPSLPAYIP